MAYQAEAVAFHKVPHRKLHGHQREATLPPCFAPMVLTQQVRRTGRRNLADRSGGRGVWGRDRADVSVCLLLSMSLRGCVPCAAISVANFYVAYEALVHVLVQAVGYEEFPKRV